jgi:hypothetical protein
MNAQVKKQRVKRNARTSKFVKKITPNIKILSFYLKVISLY